MTIYIAIVSERIIINMKCPFCGFEESKVTDSRPIDDNEKIRRRRECISCQNRFTTHEMVENIPIIIIKRDKTRQTFNRDKLLLGLVKACEKRPVSVSVLEKAASDIEKQLYNSLEKEISSEQVGELCMDRLKEIDGVAYVRFASVYRQFKDINTFKNEISKLLANS